jgi:hypothetical protein
MNQLATASTPSPTRTLYTVKQFAGRHPFLTESALRFQIFNRMSNGLEPSGALVCLGRKRLIDEERYFGWIDSQQEHQHE